jgi:glyoxylate reductase
MGVLACDRPPGLVGWAFRPRNFMKNPPRRIEGEQEANIRRGFSTLSPFDEIPNQSDVISLHVPLTPETREMIDAGALAMMKPTAILINTSRGPLIDEADLGVCRR